MNKIKKEYFFGVDLSLRSTGFIGIDENKKIIILKIISSNSSDPIEKRIIDISDKIFFEIDKFKKENIVVFIEGLAFGAKGNSLLNLSGLNHFIRIELYTNNIYFQMIPPTALKKFITGKGNVKKESMLLNIIKKYNVNFFDNDDLGDAFGLAVLAHNNYFQEIKKQ